MKQTGFYKIHTEYIELISKLTGIYKDSKERPIYCCFQDKDNEDIYWAIPTSDIAHRPQKQLERIIYLCNLPERDLRSCYYHIGTTNRPAIFKISNILPITEKYIAGEYISKGQHLILKDNNIISAIMKKARRILLAEEQAPNKFE